MQHTIFGNVELRLTCSDEELKKIVVESIEEFQRRFSIDDLFYSIRNKTTFEKAPNTNYSGTIDFTRLDLDNINYLIWEHIWDRKLMIDLTNKKNPFSQSDTIYFIKVV